MSLNGCEAEVRGGRETTQGWPLGLWLRLAVHLVGFFYGTMSMGLCL